MFKILLLENIHPVASDRLKDAGFSVELEESAFDETRLLKIIENFNILGIRSKTRLSKTFIKQARHLLTIGAFCIGTDQIDLVEANLNGIPVFNAPYSNTRSVAELSIAYMISLVRKLTDRNQSVHQGHWIKSATGCNEIRGKTLGIIGYGHIGSQLSVMAESLGLRVIFYDIVKKLPMGNAQPVDNLEELLKKADFVSLHVPDTTETKKMISSNQLNLMKKGSYLMNASRGNVLDIEVLAEFIKSRHLAGAAIDVYPVEPENNKEIFKTPLQGLPNVILTPHIGGSTEEAQENIAREVSDSFIKFVKNGSTTGAVNFPNADLTANKRAVRLLNVHQNIPGVLKNINEIVASTGANISGQYLATDSYIGYLVMDMEHTEAEQVNKKISALPTSIKTRVIS